MIDKSKLPYCLSIASAALSLFVTLCAQASESPGTLPNIAERVKALDQQLYTGKEAPKIEAQDLAIMTKAAADLAAALPDPGLKVGVKAPNFTLRNPQSKPVELNALLRKGPVILVFYRGAWCPYCNLELKALNESLPHFKKYGASLIAVTPQTPDKSLEQVKQDRYPFEILSDLDDKVIKKYKLYWEVPAELDAVYKRSFGLNVAAFNGNDRRGLPVPGTFVIDKSGIVRAAFADTDYKKRMEPADILAALQQLPRRKTFTANNGARFCPR